MRKLLFLTISAIISASAHAQYREQFTIQKSSIHDEMNGEIEWPAGKINDWNGFVLVLIPPGGPYNRNGWIVHSLETRQTNINPLKGLASSLSRAGIAVVRFEHPAARPPQFHCQDTIHKNGLNENTLRSKCIKYDLIKKMTVARYVSDIESILSHIQKKIPAAKDKLVLFGFSEGLIHAAAIADRGNVLVSSLLSVGAPAEQLSAAARWQAVERMTETLPDFDLDKNGIITNSEISEGYKNGIGNFMALRSWQSSDDYWDKDNQRKLFAALEQNYAGILKQFNSQGKAGNLNWLPISGNITAPYTTDSFFSYLFHNPISAAEIMQRRRIPGLFLWGEKDAQVSIPRQLTVIEKALENGAIIDHQTFPGRYHLLSSQKDNDWFEDEFTQYITESVRHFLDKTLPHPSNIIKIDTHHTTSSASALDRR